MVNGKLDRLSANKPLETQELKSELKNPEAVSDFKEIFDDELKDLKISGHAAKRLKERNLEMDSAEYLKLREAVSQLRKKGGKDSLVITEKAD